jgi:hypothetical protein
VNFVRLFSAAASDEFDIHIFNAGDYAKAVEQKVVSEAISKILYPSDAAEAGRELRLLQEYFFVACAVHDITRRFFERGLNRPKSAQTPGRRCQNSRLFAAFEAFSRHNICPNSRVSREGSCKFRTVRTVRTVIFVFVVFEEQRVTEILSARLANLW